MKFIKIIISTAAISLGLSNLCMAAMLHPTKVRLFQNSQITAELNNTIKQGANPMDLLEKTTWQIDVNVPGPDGRYPIHEAVIAKNLPLVTKLVENFGANLSVQTKSGFTPLDLAIDRNLNDIRDYLQTRNALTTENPKRARINQFKDQVNQLIRQNPNPAALLNLLKDYKTQYPQYVKDFVSLDLSGGSKIPLLMEIVLRHYNDTFLDVVRYLVEEMGANVNSVEVHGAYSVLDYSQPGSKIYNYLVSKDAKTTKDLRKEGALKTESKPTPDTSPIKEKVLDEFKAEVDQLLFTQPFRTQQDPNPTDLLNLLKTYKTKYPQYVNDFVSLDLSSGSNIPLLREIVLRFYNDTFLDVVIYLVEEMGANVNSREAQSETILDICNHYGRDYERAAKIYNYLVSKDAKTAEDLLKEYLAGIKKEKAKTSKDMDF